MRELAGTTRLLRLIVRRERVALPVWILVLASLPAGTAGAFAALYPTEAELTRAASAIAGNPAFVAFLGPVYAPTLGGLTVWRVGALSAVVIGIMNVLTVTRHTRAEEEAGRRELLGSTALGRHAPLFAVLLIVMATDVLIGLAAAAGMASAGLAGSGVVAFGLSITVAGWVFAGVGAVGAQMFDSSRTANGMGVAVAAVSFLMRVIGDAGSSSGFGFLSWISPVGLVSRVRPFAGERWWIIGLLGFIAVALIATAQAISARRDVGAGVFASQSGPAAAAASLGSAGGLAFRLQKGVMAAWAAGFALFGFFIGAATEGFADLLDENPFLREIIEQVGGESAVADAFLASMLTVFGLMSAAQGVQATTWLRTEEIEQRVDPLLATSTGRLRWMASHGLIGVLAPSLDLLAVGAAAGLSYGAAVGDIGGRVPRLVAAALVQLPAVWLLVGVSLLLFGLVPRLSGLAWAVVGLTAFLTLFGATLRLPQALIDLSAFNHLPKVPGSTVTALPLVWLLATGAVVAFLGFFGFSRRDVG
jgi:ABC-2 type transport system permease protein